MFKTLMLLVVMMAGPWSVAIAEEGLPTRVLFVGNSYLYYNDSLHNHVERMAQAQHVDTPGRPFQFKSATIGGARLKHHNLDWLLTPDRKSVV